MSYKQILDILQNNCTETVDDSLQKVIKPVNEQIIGGEYSPLLLPNLQGYQTPSPLNDDLVKLRAGNKEVQSKDLTTTQVTTIERKIEYWNRIVSMEQYVPEEAHPTKALIYFHGGSFYGGQIKDVSNMLKFIAEKGHVQVFNVDYTLAPEGPFPEGILDGVAVSLYCKQCLGLTDVILAGDSAGGNICLGVDNLLKKLGYGSSAARILLYPVVTLADDSNNALWDLSEFPIDDSQKNIRNNYHDLFHSLNTIMRKYYLKHDEDPAMDMISPLHDQSGVEQAPTLLMVGEYDFFRLQDQAYAKKLINNDSKVKFIQYNGMAHAFAPMVGVLPQADDTCLEAAKFINRL